MGSEQEMQLIFAINRERETSFEGFGSSNNFLMHCWGNWRDGDAG